MDYVLVRLLKRKTSIELDLSGFIKTELTTRDGSLDLSLFVYQMDESIDNSLICICSEHTAGNELDPQTRACLDFTNTKGDLFESPTQNKIFNFKFSSDAHCEIKFGSEVSLREFAQQLIVNFQHAHKDVSSREMITYAYQKYEALDEEWQRVCELSDKVKKWVMKGQKYKDKSEI
jgi:hypothetical protein